VHRVRIERPWRRLVDEEHAAASEKRNEFGLTLPKLDPFSPTIG
jgi:hypothetical protein